MLSLQAHILVLLQSLSSSRTPFLLHHGFFDQIFGVEFWAISVAMLGATAPALASLERVLGMGAGLGRGWEEVVVFLLHGDLPMADRW